MTAAPTARLAQGAAIDVAGRKVPVLVSWGGNDPDGNAQQTGVQASGVARYDMQVSINGGATWANVALPAGTARQATVKVAPDTDVLFRVRAQDKAGNRSAWKKGSAFRVAAVQDGKPGIVYAKAWQSQSATDVYAGWVRYSSTSGATATMAVNDAKGLAFVSTLGPDRGKAEIWVDGVKVKTVDLYSASRSAAQVVWSVADLNPAAPHTVIVKVTGTRHAASSGVRVDVDALLVMR
jgi:hypothetical protein